MPNFTHPGTDFGIEERSVAKLTELGDDSPEGQAELVQYVTDSFLEDRDSRFYVEREWVVTLLYYIGEQYVSVDPYTGNVIFNPRTDSEQVRMVINRILPAVEHRVARLLRVPPNPVVLPETGKAEDQDRARMATRVLQGFFNAIGMKWKAQEHALWTELCSCAFFKTCWDPTAGENAIIDADVDPMTGQMVPKTDENGDLITYPEGDILVDVVSPLEMYPDRHATSMEHGHIRHMTQAKELDIETARALFPDHAQDIQPNSADEIYGRGRASPIFSALRDFPLFSAGKPNAPGHDSQSRVLLLERWEAPLGMRGLGRHIILANRTILLNEQTPRGYRPIPYRMTAASPVPGRFWPTSVMTQSLPIQDEINRRHSQITENLNQHGWMRYKAPRTASISVQPLEGRADKIYSYIPVMGKELEPMEPPRLPAEAFPHLEAIHQQFDEEVGLHDVSRGQSPSTARTGRAIFFLQEQDDTRLAPERERLFESIRGVAEDVLRLGRVYWDTERVVHTYGVTDMEAIRFTREDLGIGGRVIIDPQSNYPISRAAKLDTVIELAKTGVFNDPITGMPDPKKVMYHLDMLDTQALFKPDSVHRARARENTHAFEEAVRSGQVPQLRQATIYENSDIHLEEYRELTNTGAWDRANLSQRMALILLIQQHERFQLAKQGIAVPGMGQVAQAVGPELPPQPTPAQGAGSPVGGGAGGVNPPVGEAEAARNRHATESTGGGDRGMDKNRDGVPPGGNPPGAPVGGGLGDNY